MSAFYTPIFERGWVKKMKEETQKEAEDKALKYEEDSQDSPQLEPENIPIVRDKQEQYTYEKDEQ